MVGPKPVSVTAEQAGVLASVHPHVEIVKAKSQVEEVPPEEQPAAFEQSWADLSVKDLYALVKEHELEGVNSKSSKAELVAALEASDLELDPPQE